MRKHLLIFCLLTASAFASPPKPERYVTDQTGSLSVDAVNALNSKLTQYERDTSNQIIVYLDHSLNGQAIEEYTTTLMHDWHVGKKGKDNGVGIFCFMNDHKMRIATGYGTEGALPDAACKRILDEIIKPAFKAKLYSQGLDRAVDAIIAKLAGEENKGTGKTVQESSGHGGWIIFGILLGGIGLCGLAVTFMSTKCKHKDGLGIHSYEEHSSSGGHSSSSPSYDSGSSFGGGWSSGDSGSDSSSGSSDSGGGYSGGGGDSGGGGASSDW